MEDFDGHLVPLVDGTLPRPVNHDYYDRQSLTQEAIQLGIEYVLACNGTLSHFIEDVQAGIEDAMAEAARERALDWKADELGYRY